MAPIATGRWWAPGCAMQGKEPFGGGGDSATPFTPSSIAAGQPPVTRGWVELKPLPTTTAPTTAGSAFL